MAGRYLASYIGVCIYYLVVDLIIVGDLNFFLLLVFSDSL